MRNVIREVTGLFQCVPGVVGQTVEGSAFNKEFVEFKRQFDVVFNDMRNCAALGSINQQYKFVWQFQCAIDSYFAHNIFYDFHSHRCVNDNIAKYERSFADLIDKVSMVRDSSPHQNLSKLLNCIPLHPQNDCRETRPSL